MSNTGIHVLDNKSEEIVGYFTNNSKKMMVLDNVHTRNADDHSETFDFKVPYKYTQSFENQNRVLISDEFKGKYREFTIKNVETSDNEIYIQSNGAWLDDLQKNSEPLPPMNHQNITVDEAVTIALARTGYEKGHIDFDGFIDLVTTEYKTPYDVLLLIEELTDLQFNSYITVEGNSIVSRKIEMKEGKSFGGKELVRGYNVTGIKKRESSDELVTALILTSTDSKGKALVTKVYDEDARDRWGNNGKYSWSIYNIEAKESDKMTTAKMEAKGQKVLKQMINTKVEYEVTAVEIHKQLSKQARYGDRIRVRDIVYQPHFYMEATVKSVTRNIFDDASKQFTLGEIKTFKESDLRKYFTSLKSELNEKLNDNITNLDTIIGQISEDVAYNSIHKAVQPPEYTDGIIPINKLWLDTSTQPAILKRWNGTQWIIDSPTKPEDVGAVSKEVAMIDSLEMVYKNVANQHLELQKEVSTILQSEYLVDNAIKSKLTQDLDNSSSIFIALGNIINTKKELTNPTMTDVIEVQSRLDEYGQSVKDLRETIVKAQSSIDARLKLLQSQYSDEKFKDAMNKVAGILPSGKYDMTTGILTADIPNKQALSDLETKLKTDYQSAINQSATNIKAEIKQTTDGISSTVNSLDTSVKAVKTQVDNLDIPTQQELDNLKAEAIQASNSYTQAQADLAETNAKAYADGIIDAEEQARIDEALANLKTAKSYADTKAQQAQEASKSYADSQVDAVELRVNTTESDISTLKGQISLKVSSDDVTKLVDDKMNPIQTQVNSQKATLDLIPSQIEARVSKTDYTTDKNGIISRLDTADSARTQLSNEIKDRVTLTNYNNDKATNETRLKTMETNISQNGQAITLKASKDEYDKTKQTLNKALTALDIVADGFTVNSEANGDKSILSVDPNAIKLNSSLIELGTGDVLISKGITTIKNAVITNAHVKDMSMDKLTGGILNLGGYTNPYKTDSSGNIIYSSVTDDEGNTVSTPVLDDSKKVALPEGEINFRDDENNILFQISSENKGADKFTVRELTVDEPIKNDYIVSKSTGSMTYYVRGSYYGSDDNDGLSNDTAFMSIQKAVDSVPDFTNDTYTIIVTDEVDTDEHIQIRSKVGGGSIVVDFQNGTHYCRFSIEGCQCRVTLQNASSIRTIDNDKAYMIQNWYSHYVTVDNVALNGNNATDLVGIKCYGGGNTYITGCEIQNVTDCVSGNYLNNVYMWNNTGKGSRYGAIAWRGSTVNIYGTAPIGGTSNATKSYAGNLTVDATYPVVATKTAVTSSTTKTKTFKPSSSNYYLYSGYNMWAASYTYHYGYPIVGQGYGSPQQVGAWFGFVDSTGASMKSVLNGKTIKSVKVKLTRSSGVGNSADAKVHLRMHKYTSQPSSAPSFSSAYKEIIMDWSETKTVDVTSTFKSLINGGSYAGFGLKPTSQDVAHYAQLSKSMEVTVVYV